MKKKSVAIPTRTTKALYSNRSEYEKKRASKAAAAGLRPSSSTANLDTQKFGHSKSSLASSQRSKAICKTKKMKYLSSGEESKSKIISKSSRDKGKFIEFTLQDDEMPNSKLEDQKPKAKLIDGNGSTLRRLYATKSQKLFPDSYSKPTIVSSKLTRNQGLAKEKSNQRAKFMKYKHISKRPKTSRNPTLRTYKEVQSNKEVEGRLVIPKQEPGMSLKSSVTKPSQVKIYLKNEE